MGEEGGKIQDLVLCVFIHGFKGTDSTFLGFPSRLQHMLEQTVNSAEIECIVYPAYETKGDLNAASEKFVDWLTTIVVEKEVARGEGGGAGKAKVVLCAHSMGGIVAADAILSISSCIADADVPLWPRVIACIAFDTPYFGLHPLVFKNTASKAVGYAQTFKDIVAGAGMLGVGLGLGKQKESDSGPSTSTQKQIGVPSPPSDTSSPTASKSSWNLKSWTPALYGVGGALLAGVAAGAVYQRRSDVTQGWTWLSDHMQYVGNLWDEKTLRKRVESLIAVGKERGILFQNFYTYLPSRQPTYTQPRTFIILPMTSSPFLLYFSPNSNTVAEDEVQAHIGMFEASSNDGYYDLGLKAAEVIRKAVEMVREREKYISPLVV